jgi:hypothetical protein
MEVTSALGSLQRVSSSFLFYIIDFKAFNFMIIGFNLSFRSFQFAFNLFSIIPIYKIILLFNIILILFNS